MTVHPTSHKHIAIWLFSCCGLIFLMVIVGAITRLTDSGLSIVEWRPLIGSLPPLSETEWHRIFDLYKQSPEFQQEHFWMELSDFKRIFFWEWFHRLLGRLIGLAYGLPLLWFWASKQIPTTYGRPLIGLLLLGAAQGYMGWFMVKSGLVDQPAVSHYRLAAHLGLAFLIFALLLKTGLNLIMHKGENNKALTAHLWITLSSLVLTIFWGACTAGLDAGLIYNSSFPLMNGHFLPPEPLTMRPIIINFLENHAYIQFTHRWLAITTTLLTFGFWVHARKKNALNGAVHALAGIIVLQFTLGIITLLSQVFLPIAVMHQGGALITLALIIINMHKA